MRNHTRSMAAASRFVHAGKARLFAGAIALALAVCGTARATPVTFNYTGSFMSFTALEGGLYDISVAGAQGGTGNGGSGGLGGSSFGVFSLYAGEVLDIAVGGAGLSSGHGSSLIGGGGGGTFVVDHATGNPLIVGGGGGGALNIGGSSGFAGGATLTGSNGGAAGGSNGAGGGGFSTDGSDSGPATGGKSYAHGLAGGLGDALGGFGGGGGTAENCCSAGGGGGGGYAGGAGGLFFIAGGGGSSFDIGANAVLTPGTQSGNGFVTITQEVPEPASLAVLGMGLAGIAAVRRRRAARADR